jgi:hypothetical protein
LLNGRDFWIYDNLFDFLTLQAEDENPYVEQYLWVDQLCIDQSNDIEKGHQVDLMAKIYRSAANTIIWLGLPGKGNAMGGDVAAKILSGIQDLAAARTTPPRWTDRDNIPEEIWVVTDPSTVGDTLYKYPYGVLRVLSLSDYWARVWIIQEVLLSRQLMLQCGIHTIHWRCIDQCFRRTHLAIGGWIAPSSIEDGRRLGKLESLIVRKQAAQLDTNYAMSWSQAMDMSANSVSSRVHDRVFGLLGIVRDDLRFPVDYDMSPRDLFNKVMEMETTRVLENPVEELEISEFAEPYEYYLVHSTAQSLGLTVEDDTVFSIMSILIHANEEKDCSSIDGRAVDHCPSGLRLLDIGILQEHEIRKTAK